MGRYPRKYTIRFKDRTFAEFIQYTLFVNKINCVLESIR